MTEKEKGKGKGNKQEKVFIQTFAIRQILDLVKKEKWVFPEGIQREGDIHSPKKRQEILDVIKSGNFCGELRLWKVGNVYNVLNGRQRTCDILWQIEEWKKEENFQIPKSFLDYEFRAIVHENISKEQALDTFEDLNGKYSVALKPAEIAKNRTLRPSEWDNSTFWNLTSIKAKRADHVALFQYSCQLIEMGNSIVGFDTAKYEYQDSTIESLMSALAFVSEGITTKEKWANLGRLPFIFLFAIRAKSEGISPIEYAGFCQELFQTSPKFETKRAAFGTSSGTTKKDSILLRYDAMKTAYEATNLHSCCYKIPESKKVIKKSAKEKELEQQIAVLRAQKRDLEDARKKELEAMRAAMKDMENAGEDFDALERELEAERAGLRESANFGIAGKTW